MSDRYRRGLFDQSAAPHCYQTEFVATVYTDSTRATVMTPGHIVQSVDGIEYQDEQHNWNGGQELSWDGNPVPGNPVPASSLMVALQYGPTNELMTGGTNYFAPMNDAAMTPANVAAADARIYSIRMWHRIGGAHAAP